MSTETCASSLIIADVGMMIEIRKRDIVDINSLSMEPSGRNCSFRAVDVSHSTHITDAKVGRLMTEVFGLVNGRHIQPIRSITLYGFDRVLDAIAYTRRDDI
ncbi:hypothetical protein F4819DRAFT_147753 [Hypoxylon fuscum]|nr:hypothetical protein F4819DRAFT_147753 [Hypoxylon fuscum]